MTPGDNLEPGSAGSSTAATNRLALQKRQDKGLHRTLPIRDRSLLLFIEADAQNSPAPLPVRLQPIPTP
jgi:hypothetical protein